MLRGDDVVELQRLLTGLGFPWAKLTGFMDNKPQTHFRRQLNAAYCQMGSVGKKQFMLERLESASEGLTKLLISESVSEPNKALNFTGTRYFSPKLGGSTPL